MKKIILATTLLSLLALAGNTHAQNDKEKGAKKNKRVTINITTEENGKTTVIDTSFDANDQAAIDQFMRANNIKKPLPPLPPKPPLPPTAPNAPNAPTPPAPPDRDEEDYSFEFNFDSDDMQVIKDNVNERMEEARVQIELAKKEIEIALKNADISKKEMEHLREEIKKSLNNIDIKVENDKKHQRIVIKKRITTADDDNTSNSVANAETKKDKNSETRKQQTKTDKENQLELTDLKIYPNPNNGSFDLQFSLETQGTINISVMDANGKQVFSESLIDFSGAYNKHIELPASSKGTYLLNIKQNDKWLHKKVIVK